MGGGWADGGQKRGPRADGGQKRGSWADGWRMGSGWADGQMARRIEVDGWMSGRADKSRRGANKADEWQSERTGRGLGFTGGRPDRQTSRGFKRPRTSFPTSLSCARTTCLIAEPVCRVLGSALGSEPGLRICFVLNNIFAIQT